MCPEPRCPWEMVVAGPRPLLLLDCAVEMCLCGPCESLARVLMGIGDGCVFCEGYGDAGVGSLIRHRAGTVEYRRCGVQTSGNPSMLVCRHISHFVWVGLIVALVGLATIRGLQPSTMGEEQTSARRAQCCTNMLAS